MKLKTQQQFLEEAKKIQGNKYDYSLVEYIGSHIKIKIICPEHGIFEQKPCCHLNGEGCIKCSYKKLSKDRSLTKDEFILKSKEIHGDKYDYGLVDYKNSYTKVKIICSEHGIFEQTPILHYNSGCNCPKCKGRNRTTDDFIKESKKIHSDKYDYSLVDYINSDTKVKIICSIHGVFEQHAYNHLIGMGCDACGGTKTKNTKIFVDDAKKIHGDKYDYSLVDYINNKRKVKIICPEHGTFEQRPDDHYNGRGCLKCSGSEKSNTIDFIKKSKKIHDDKYNYSLVDYINTDNKVKIICSIHGIFEQSPSSHLSGCGCQECSNNVKKTTQKFIEESNKIHENKYNYSLVNYVNSHSKVKIICPIHGIFEQKAYSHSQGIGCPSCKESKGEKEIRKILNENKISYESQKSFKKCKHKNILKFDFYLSDFNICIEFDGEQHFNCYDYFGGIEGFEICKIRDEIKTKFCLDNNITLCRIRYDENINDKMNEIFTDLNINDFFLSV